MDLHRLGYTHNTIFFSLAVRDALKVDALMRKLDRLPAVTWVFELAGRLQYAISITSKNNLIVSEYLDRLSEIFKDQIVDKSVCTQLDFEYYGRRYLMTKRIPTSFITFPLYDRTEEIDTLSHDIIMLLSYMESPTLKKMSDELGVTVSTVERRKKDLEQRGIIKTYFRWVDTSLLGRSMYILRLVTKGLPSTFKNRFFQYTRSNKDIIYAIRSLGAWDFEFGVELESSLSLSNLVNALWHEFSEYLTSVEPLPVLRYLKVKSYPGVVSKIET